MRYDDHLPLLLDSPQGRHDTRKDECVVEVILGLINNQWNIGIGQHSDCQKNRVTLPVRELQHWYVFWWRGLRADSDDRLRLFRKRLQIKEDIPVAQFLDYLGCPINRNLSHGRDFCGIPV